MKQFLLNAFSGIPFLLGRVQRTCERYADTAQAYPENVVADMEWTLQLTHIGCMLCAEVAPVAAFLPRVSRRQAFERDLRQLLGCASASQQPHL